MVKAACCRWSAKKYCAYLSSCSVAVDRLQKTEVEGVGFANSDKLRAFLLFVSAVEEIFEV